LDEIGITVWQKGDEYHGVQIPGADVAGGSGVPSAGPNTSKGKGKAVMPIRSDDEVSSNDDQLLQMRRRLLHSDGCPVNGPPSTG
jgi:hypothetical protein